MRVVIAEDNVLLSEGLTLLLSRAGFEVTAVTVDGDAFLAAVEEHRPDVTIVDVRLPPTFKDEGIRAALAARRKHPDLPILVLSQYVETVYATRLLADSGGGVGYLLKDRVGRVEEFLDAVNRVARGGSVMDPQVVAQLVARRHDPLSALTERENQVLALMAEGLDNAEIAAKLFIVERSVHKHISAIFTKLGLSVGDSGHRRVRAVLAFLSEPAKRVGLRREDRASWSGGLRQLGIQRDQRNVARLRDRYVCCVVAGDVVPQLPNSIRYSAVRVEVNGEVDQVLVCQGCRSIVQQAGQPMAAQDVRRLVHHEVRRVKR